MKKLKRRLTPVIIIQFNTNILLLLILCMISTTELASSSRLHEDEDDDDSHNTTNLLTPEVTSPMIPHNESGVGLLLGDQCYKSCSTALQNVYCDEYSHTCECEKKYPVRLSPNIGCAKPVRLGEQCFYDRTCSFNELHSICIQVHHNAVCKCKPGYHVVELQKPRGRVFCSEDILIIKTNMNTLFGMAAGIAIITGLICFVLKLYSRARYAPPRHYANANLPPPILFASETGIPLAVHRPPSRDSGTRSAPPFSRRPSSSFGLIGNSSSSRAGAARAAAILLISYHFAEASAGPSTSESMSVPHHTEDEDLDDEQEEEDDDLFRAETVASSSVVMPSMGRDHDENNDLDDGFDDVLLQDTRSNKFRGSRRPSTASYNSSSSSVRSYGIRRFEQENEQRYQRQLARLQAAQTSQQVASSVPSSSSSGQVAGSSSNLLMHSSSLGSCCGGSLSYGHSGRSPLSTDDLLPSVTELNEPTSQPGSSGSQHKNIRTTSLQPIIAPSSSSDSSGETSPVNERARH